MVKSTKGEGYLKVNPAFRRVGYCCLGLRVVDSRFDHSGFNTLNDRVKGIFDHALRVDELDTQSSKILDTVSQQKIIKTDF